MISNTDGGRTASAARRTRRRMRKGSGAALAALVILAVFGLLAATAFGAPEAARANHARPSSFDHPTTPKPSIVLVHGAWADGSSWNGVTALLQADGFTVYVLPNPLRGLSADSAYVASFLTTITGPISWSAILMVVPSSPTPHTGTLMSRRWSL